MENIKSVAKTLIHILYDYNLECCDVRDSQAIDKEFVLKNSDWDTFWKLKDRIAHRDLDKILILGGGGEIAANQAIRDLIAARNDNAERVDDLISLTTDGHYLSSAGCYFWYDTRMVWEDSVVLLACHEVQNGLSMDMPFCSDNYRIALSGRDVDSNYSSILSFNSCRDDHQDYIPAIVKNEGNKYFLRPINFFEAFDFQLGHSDMIRASFDHEPLEVIASTFRKYKTCPNGDDKMMLALDLATKISLYASPHFGQPNLDVLNINRIVTDISTEIDKHREELLEFALLLSARQHSVGQVSAPFFSATVAEVFNLKNIKEL